MSTFWWLVLAVWAVLNLVTVAVGDLRYRRNIRAARQRWENEIDRGARTDEYRGPMAIGDGVLRPAHSPKVERAPVPTWYLLLVRDLMEAGNQLADEVDDQDAVDRWERALTATGEGVIR